MITRAIDIQKELRKGKVLIIFGARQIGKTTSIGKFLEKTNLKYKMVSGDSLQIATSLSECTETSTKNFVDNYDLLVIDEAQKIPNIGRALKLMTDNYSGKYYIASGSASFDLANKTAEALTGRKRVLKLFPIAQCELNKNLSRMELQHNLESYLIYGSYPEVINQSIFQEKQVAIEQIANSYLLKDILELEGIKNSQTILSLLKLLAFQIGSEVSTTELGEQVGMDYRTVTRYLDLMEKAFIITSLSGFSRNLRKEIVKMPKYYFVDIGVRNALISNFNRLADRDDVGQLWENFLYMERIKRNTYMKNSANYYFWRTYDQKEIDMIEETGGKLYGWEFKWSNKKTRVPKIWLETYKNAEYMEINRENYLDFILE